MDPLITNGIDPALLRVIEKRGDERDALPRRKRPAAHAKFSGEEIDQELDPETPQHTLDDLA
jgi:hypothetical protein